LIAARVELNGPSKALWRNPAAHLSRHAQRHCLVPVGRGDFADGHADFDPHDLAVGRDGLRLGEASRLL
jgi:hypothetical protein